METTALVLTIHSGMLIPPDSIHKYVVHDNVIHFYCGNHKVIITLQEYNTIHSYLKENGWVGKFSPEVLDNSSSACYSRNVEFN